MPAAPARPRQVTWSAAIITIGSLFVLLSAWQVVAGIGTLETRESVEEFLAEGAGEGLALSVPTALDALRVTAMVAAALAVTSAILGWQVLQKSHSARVVLSVLALPIFITGTVTGGLISAVVVASIITLWLSPAKEWFAGRPIPEPPTRRPRGATKDPTPQQQAFLPPSQPSQQAGQGGAGERPSPYDHPFGQSAAQPSDGQSGQPGQRPPYEHTGQQPGAWQHPASPRRQPRPPALLVACLLTWSLCAVTLMLILGGLTLLWTQTDAVADLLREQDPAALEQGLSLRDIQVATTVMFAVLGLWCLGACVAAFFAMRGSTAGRVVLLACAAVAAALALAFAFGSLIFAVPLVGCVTVVALLVRPEVRAWR